MQVSQDLQEETSAANAQETNAGDQAPKLAVDQDVSINTATIETSTAAEVKVIVSRLEQRVSALESERDSLKSMVDKLGAPGDRAESTYQNIIAALLDCIAGNLPGVEKHPSFASEAKLIEAIDEYFRGYSGLSKSNLSRKFPAAKRAMQSQ